MLVGIQKAERTFLTLIIIFSENNINPTSV